MLLVVLVILLLRISLFLLLLIRRILFFIIIILIHPLFLVRFRRAASLVYALYQQEKQNQNKNIVNVKLKQTRKKSPVIFFIRFVLYVKIPIVSSNYFSISSLLLLLLLSFLILTHLLFFNLLKQIIKPTKISITSFLLIRRIVLIRIPLPILIEIVISIPILSTLLTKWGVWLLLIWVHSSILVVLLLFVIIRQNLIGIDNFRIVFCSIRFLVFIWMIFP